MLPLTATGLAFLTRLPRCSTPRSSLWEGPVQISHGGSQGFKSPHLHPQHCRSERRQPRAGDARCHVAAAPRPQAHVTVQPGRLSETRRLGPRPHTLTTERGRRRLPTDGRSSRIQPLPVDHAVEAATAQPPPTTTTPSSRPAAGRARPGPASSATVHLGQTCRCGHAGRPRRPAIPAARLPAPLPRSTSIPVGHSGRWKARTPDGHPGRRRPDTGHLDAQTPAPDTGHRSVGQPPVGHWTLSPDTDADRATTAQPASGPLGPPRRATAYWNAQPCSCSRTTRQLLGRSIGQAAPRRTAVLKRESLGVRRRVGG
jgi:hypothetical protein